MEGDFLPIPRPCIQFKIKRKTKSGCQTLRCLRLAGAGPVAERARADEFDAVGGARGEASEVAIAVSCGLKSRTSRYQAPTNRWLLRESRGLAAEARARELGRWLSPAEGGVHRLFAFRRGPQRDRRAAAVPAPLSLSLSASEPLSQPPRGRPCPPVLAPPARPAHS